MRKALARRTGPLLAFNGLLVLFAWAALATAVPGPMRLLASAALILVLPGAAWLGSFRDPLDAPRLALAVVGLSSLTCVAGVALQALVVGGPSRSVLLAVIAAVVNAGVVATGGKARLDRETPWRVLAIVFAVGFVCASAAALWLVPPLEDHDMEVRGTAYGLVSDGKPYFQTNREVYLAFSHPILSNVQVAGSLVLTGEIEAVRPSYDSARRAEAAAARGEEVPWMDWWRSDHAEFVERPALVGTRACGALFSAMVLALLADLVASLTRRRWAGVAAAAFYGTFPETIVRSAYAGYFSVTVFAMLVAAMFFDREDRRNTLGWIVAAGVFAALVDHKTVVLVLGAAGLAAARRTLDRRVIALGLGFAAGTFAWWGYGLAVNARVFVDDHIRMHIAHRMMLDNVTLFHNPDRYQPSILELWGEYAAHTGYLFLPVAFVAVVVWLFTRGDDDRRAILAVWCLAGMVAFTLTDWRQTKHLMNQLAPMVAAAVVFGWTGGKRWWRPAALLALAAALAFNLLADVHLLDDFASLSISGASDIDGW